MRRFAACLSLVPCFNVKGIVPSDASAVVIKLNKQLSGLNCPPVIPSLQTLIVFQRSVLAFVRFATELICNFVW